MAAALEVMMTLILGYESMNEMKNMMKALVPTPFRFKAVEERNEVKAITTRSGLAYDGPLPPMPPPYVNPDNEDGKETEERDKKIDILASKFIEIFHFDLIDATCAEYALKVLDFTESGDSTSIISDPPSFTPFEGSEMILEEEIEEFLKHDESLNMDLNDEFNDEEELPFSILEYAFLEKDNKLPVIISKDLKDDEKVKLIEVLKAHKSALAWKISDIKGIDPKFCTHKILMEDDYKPVVQMQRRVP
ncbi:hypothetical protein Tco_1385495 [Tanacetum coccineum]